MLTQCLTRIAEVMRDLSDEDIEALVAVFPPQHAKSVRNCVRLLRENKEDPVGEALAPALDEYWEKALKNKVETALRRLAIGAGSRPHGRLISKRDSMPEYRKPTTCFFCATARSGNARHNSWEVSGLRTER